MMHFCFCSWIQFVKVTGEFDMFINKKLECGSCKDHDGGGFVSFFV